MSAADAALHRAHAYLQEARDRAVNTEDRVGALDSARAALLDARRARAIPEHLHPVLVALCDIGIIDENPVARALVAQVVEELCLRDIKSFIIVCMPYLFRTLADHHVLVIKRGVRALTTLFRKVLGYVVSVGVGDGPTDFPTVNLHQWLEIQKKVVELMDSPDAGIQKAATKFTETVILALSYSEGRASPEHFTLNYAAYRALNHPLLNLVQLEMEGKRCVSMVAGLIYAGLGVTPPPLPPSESVYIPKSRVACASLMTALSVLGNLMKRRDKILDMTVPPLLLAVFAITGSRGPPSPAFLRLSEGERRSIIMTLRLTLLAARAYPHTRNNAEVVGAANEIWQFERAQKHERAQAAARAGEQKARLVATAVQPIAAPISSSLKRPRAPDVPIPRQFVPANEAFSYAEYIIRSMPPNEVVHFVMTRLLLDTPDDPNLSRIPPPPFSTDVVNATEVHDPRLQKRPRKAENVIVAEAELPGQTAVAPVRRSAPVRRNAPPVVPLKLSKDGSVRLLYQCCQSILEREKTALASGAGPLRDLVLAKQLAEIAFNDTEMSRQLCDAACTFIVDKIESRGELALAWLHAVLFADRTGRSKQDIEVARLNLLLLSKQRSNALALQVEAPPASCKKMAFGTFVKSEANVISESGQADASGRDAGTEGGDAVTSLSVDSASPASGVPDVELLKDKKDDIVVQRCAVYEMLLSSILKKLQARNATDDTHFTRMIVDAPLIPKNVIEMLRESCRDVSQNATALKALRDIVMERCGKDRSMALNILLDLAIDADEVIRGPSIRLVADKLFAEMQGEVPSRIEEFTLHSLTTSISRLDLDGSYVLDLERRAWLFTALCAQKHELLHDMAKCYLTANQVAQGVLLKHAKQLGGQLGTSSESAVALIRGKSKERESDSRGPDGVEELALTVLNGIVKKYGRPSGAIVDAACDRFRMSGDARFLEAVLSGLLREALVAFLGDLVNLSFKPSSSVQENEDETTVATEVPSSTKSFKQMTRVIMENQPPALSPVDLLVELHALGSSPAVSNAIQACFEMKAIFKQGVVAQALQQLIGRTPVSPLLMNTVLLTRTFHSDRERYLNETILVPLISKKVWTNETLWNDFLRYCAEIKEPGKILLRLPAAQLDQAFLQKPTLLEVFRAHAAHPRFAKMIPAKHLKVIKTALLRAHRTPA